MVPIANRRGSTLGELIGLSVHFAAQDSTSSYLSDLVGVRHPAERARPQIDIFQIDNPKSSD